MEGRGREMGRRGERGCGQGLSAALGSKVALASLLQPPVLWLCQGQARGAGLWAPRGGEDRRCPPSTDFCRLRVAGSGASWRGHPLPTTLVATANGPCVPCPSRPSPHTPPQMGRKPQAALLCRVRSAQGGKRRCGLRVGLSVLGGRLQAGGCLAPCSRARVLGDPIAPPQGPCAHLTQQHPPHPSVLQADVSPVS